MLHGVDWQLVTDVSDILCVQSSSSNSTRRVTGCPEKLTTTHLRRITSWRANISFTQRRKLEIMRYCCCCCPKHYRRLSLHPPVSLLSTFLAFKLVISVIYGTTFPITLVLHFHTLRFALSFFLFSPIHILYPWPYSPRANYTDRAAAAGRRS
jgi:hypothetical protein